MHLKKIQHNNRITCNIEDNVKTNLRKYNISRKRNIKIECPSHNFFFKRMNYILQLMLLAKLIIIIWSHESENLENSEHKVYFECVSYL